MRESLYKIAADAKQKTPYKKRKDYFNNNIEVWKYDNLKTDRKNDKLNRKPIDQVEKILEEEVIQMIKPRRMNVLVKGESFYKIQSRDRKPTKRNYAFFHYFTIFFM